RAPRRRGRPRRPLAPGRVRVRHRTVLVPHARGLRSLLPPDVGTTTSDELDLVRLDAAYRVYGERAPGSPTSRIDVRSGTREATALFEQREPGAGRALERYLRSATRAHHAAREAFLYNTFASPRSLLSAAVWRGAPAVLPLLIRSLWSHIRRRFRDGRLRQILGYPAV